MLFRFASIFLLVAALPLLAQDHGHSHKEGEAHDHSHAGHNHSHEEKKPVPTPLEKVIELPADVLDDYVGVYYWAPHRTTIAVTFEEGILYGQPKTKPKSKLLATDMDQFFIEGVGAELSFVRDDEGQVTAMMLLEEGELQEAIRLSEEEIKEGAKAEKKNG